MHASLPAETRVVSSTYTRALTPPDACVSFRLRFGRRASKSHTRMAARGGRGGGRGVMEGLDERLDERS